MGLFGKSFEEEVRAAIDKLRPLGVKGLDARVEGKVVTLTGEAPSKDVRHRVMEEFNRLVKTENTIGQIRVAEAPAPAAGPPFASGASVSATAAATMGGAATEMYHEVVKGDTLSGLAKKYYGNGSQYMRIFDANRDQLSDPDLIKIGQKLRIPAK